MRSGAVALLFAAGALVAAAPPAAAQGSQPAVVTRAPLDRRAGVNFHALVLPETVYVGQQANYQVGVFLDDDVRRRLRRNPEFVPPEMPGMLAYELPVAHAVVPRTAASRYEVHVFERAVFPLTAGVHTIQPARLSYSLPLTSSFFSREESYTLRSQERRVVAIAPPREGRPAEFDGAVASDLSVRTMVEGASRARVGDPVRVTVRVAGRGNVNLFPRPALAPAWGQAVPAAERVTLDSTSRTVTGVKEFDWLVTPQQAGRVAVPAVRYAYFDPARETYVVTASAPESLSVRAGTLARVDSAAEATPALPLRREFRGEVTPGPASSAPYWVVIALLPIPALVVRARRRPPRPRAAPSAAAQLRASSAGGAHRAAAADAHPEPRRVRALYLRAVADRIGRRDLSLTRAGDFARLLRREGVSTEGAAEAQRLLDTLDHAAYARTAGTDDALSQRALASLATIDAEARHPRGPSMRARSAAGARLAVLLLLPAAALLAEHARATAPAAEAFARGVEAYEARAFASAARSFAEAAQFAPRSPDAWVNYGTAAWAGADTAGAAVGWQRALRLQPLAGDARARLALLPSTQLAGAAAVPPVPPSLLQWLALLGWALAWGGAAWAGWRRQPLDRPAVLLVGTIAVVLGGAALWVDERLEARQLAVVGSTGPARLQPALTADPAATLRTGEIVTVERRSGAWARVRAPGLGSAWVEWRRLRELRRI